MKCLQSGRGGGGGRAPQQVFAGRAVYVQNCQTCHGADLKGAAGPTLVDITVKMGADAIRANIQGGKGAMPSFSNLTAADMDSIMAFLANPAAAVGGGGRGGRGGRGGAQGETASLGGPVVASGPAPASIAGGNGRGARDGEPIREETSSMRTAAMEAALPILKVSKLPTLDTTAHGPFPITPSNRHGPQSRLTT